MKTVLVAACLLLVVAVNQYAAGKEMTPEVRHAAIEKILQARVTNAVVKVAKKRAHDAAVAKSSPVARALVDRSTKRYNRDLYEDIFGGYSRQQVTAFFEEFCGVDVNDALEGASAVKPEDINEGSESFLQLIEELQSQLMEHKPLGDEIKDFVKNNDMSHPDNQDELQELGIQLMTQVVEQENTLSDMGLCALHDLTSLIFRLIEMGTEGFQSGESEEWEDCYYSAMTFWGFLDSYDYSYEWMAWDISQGNAHIMNDMIRAVAADVKCMAGQVKFLKNVLEEGAELDSSATEDEAWEGTITVFYTYLGLIYEWETLTATIHEFDNFGTQIEAILDAWFGGGWKGSTTSIPDAGSTTSMPGTSTSGWTFRRSVATKELINKLDALLKQKVVAKKSKIRQ